MPFPDFLDSRMKDYLRRTWLDDYRKGGVDRVRRSCKRILYTEAETEAVVQWVMEEAGDA